MRIRRTNVSMPRRNTYSDSSVTYWLSPLFRTMFTSYMYYSSLVSIMWTVDNTSYEIRPLSGKRDGRASGVLRISCPGRGAKLLIADCQLIKGRDGLTPVVLVLLDNTDTGTTLGATPGLQLADPRRSYDNQ